MRQMEVDFELIGIKVTRQVRNFSDKLLLVTDFCDDVEANISFEKREVQRNGCEFAHECFLVTSQRSFAESCFVVERKPSWLPST